MRLGHSGKARRISSRIAELQVTLEGVALPAAKRELVDHARREDADLGLLALLQSLPEREYGSIDEVAETLHPVQPSWPPERPPRPEPESGEPPGRQAYTDPSAEPGAVRD